MQAMYYDEFKSKLKDSVCGIVNYIQLEIPKQNLLNGKDFEINSTCMGTNALYISKITV